MLLARVIELLTVNADASVAGSPWKAGCSCLCSPILCIAGGLCSSRECWQDQQNLVEASGEAEALLSTPGGWCWQIQLAIFVVWEGVLRGRCKHRTDFSWWMNLNIPNPADTKWLGVDWWAHTPAQGVTWGRGCVYRHTAPFLRVSYAHLCAPGWPTVTESRVPVAWIHSVKRWIRQEKPMYSCAAVTATAILPCLSPFQVCLSRTNSQLLAPSLKTTGVPRHLILSECRALCFHIFSFTLKFGIWSGRFCFGVGRV